MNMYRLREFIPPADGCSLVIDTSAGLVLGTLPGLERFADAITPILPHVDGVVTSPGHARYLAQRTREDAALLVRADWTNSLRGDDFVLPPETIHDVTLLDAAAALDLGASAAVVHFLLGYAETVEANCLKRTVNLALDGAAKGLPLVVDVQVTGPRVVLRSKAIELGTSYALESGASGIVVAWPGAQSFQTIKTMTGDVPVWLKPDDLDPDSPTTREALDLGAVGVWLGSGVFASSDPVAVAQAFRSCVHSVVPAGGDA
jgi:DhnA family fructose-bisphosphate aldolase class Ia